MNPPYILSLLIFFGLLLASCSSDNVITPETTKQTVFFNVDGGSRVLPIDVTQGTKLTKPTAPTKLSYTFENWYKDAGKTEVFDFDKEVISAPLTIYAKWILQQYKVTFDLNGGVGTIPEQSVAKGEMATLPTIKPTREGFAFGGWYISSDVDAKKYNFTQEIIANTTLYAKWATPLTVTFDLNNGTGNIPNQIIAEGSLATRPQKDPTRVGYYFSGWVVSNVLNARKFDFNNDFITKPTTIYAKWIIGYTIKFELNGGKGNIPPQTLGNGRRIILPAKSEIPKREGYVFKHWAISPESTAPKYTIRRATRSFTFYAIWVLAVDFEVTFNNNGGEGNVPAQTVTWGSYATKPTVILTREKRKLNGWSDSISSTTPIDFTVTPITEPTTFYAIWGYATYSLELVFNMNGGTGTIASQKLPTENSFQATKPDNPTREGYRFANWVISDEEGAAAFDFDTKIISDKTIYAKWIKTFTVNFDFNGGTGNAIEPQIVDKYGVATIPNQKDYPTREGFAFAGWYVSADVDAEKFNFTQRIIANTTLYAKWETPITLTFDNNGGVGTIAPLKLAPGGIATPPIVENNPTRDGYAFITWVTTAVADAPNFDFTAPLTESTTIYAKWGSNPHSVAFNLNGGTGTIAPQVVESGNKATKPTTDPTRPNYRFANWVISDVANAAAFNFNTAINSDTTIYAKWIKTFTVTFDFNGGTGTAIEPQIIDAGQKAVKPLVAKNPTREGYVFKNWSDSNEENASTFSFTTELITKDITIYAKWAKINTVTFDFNGGTGTAIEPKIPNPLTTTKVEKPKVTPIRKGYVLAGWDAKEKRKEKEVIIKNIDFKTYNIRYDTIITASWRNENDNILDSIKAKLVPDANGYPSTSATVNLGNKTNWGLPIKTTTDAKTLQEVANHYLNNLSKLDDYEIDYILKNIDPTGTISNKFSFRLGVGDRRDESDVIIARYEIVENWSGATTHENGIRLTPDVYLNEPIVTRYVYNHVLIFNPTKTNDAGLRTGLIKIYDFHGAVDDVNRYGSIRSFEIRINP